MRKRGRDGSGAVRTVASVVALGVAIAACGSNGPPASSPASQPTTPSTLSPSGRQSAAGAAQALERAFVSVVAKVRPQVVQISTATGLGSGVIYDRAGDIVTNAHVVGDSTSFTVQLESGKKLRATLVGRYVPDDLAVIKVDGAVHLSPATFGNSDGLQVGDIVFAVGNPLGLSSSVTEGIVSYNGRSVGEGNGVVLPSTVQTSALINPGNSGGALVDLAGDVVGIPTLAAADQATGSAAAGIGFAIPADTVRLIAPQLIATGHVTRSGRAALDISASDAVDQSGGPIGAIVTAVAPGGSAAKAGIAPGDVITAVGGTSVTDLAALETALAQLSPGARVQVTLLDQAGAHQTVSVVLGTLKG